MAVLSEQAVRAGLSNLGPTADGCSMAYLTYAAEDQNLADVAVLATFRHLQTVRLAGNRLDDLTALAAMPSLRSLDASRNRLRDADAARAVPAAAFALQGVDLSRNILARMPSSLQAHRFLSVLRLDSNEIEAIEGVRGMASLAELSLEYNRLTDLRGLEGTGLRRLHVSGNGIADLAGVEAVAGTLECLRANSNDVRTLRDVRGLSKLVSLEVAGNRIADKGELGALRHLAQLRRLHIEDNPFLSGEGGGGGGGGASDGVGSDADSDAVCGDSDAPLQAQVQRTPEEEDEAAAAAGVGAGGGGRGGGGDGRRCGGAGHLGDAVPADPSALEKDTLARCTTLYAVPQLTSLNGKEVTRFDKVKVWGARVLRRRSNPLFFLPPPPPLRSLPPSHPMFFKPTWHGLKGTAPKPPPEHSDFTQLPSTPPPPNFRH